MIRENGYKNRKRCGNVSGGKTSKLTKRLGIISIPIFTSKDLSLLNHYRKKRRDGSLYGYFQFNLVVPDELRAKFNNFSNFQKHGRIDIGEQMQKYAFEKKFF